MTRNIKQVDKCIYGKGTFNQLPQIVGEHKLKNTDFAVYVVDDVFENTDFAKRIKTDSNDMLEWVSASYEPKTEQIDNLVSKIKAHQAGELPVTIVGIGGGTLMDIAKATSLMLTTEGKAQDFQGLDLINKRGVYSMVVPTISGTGAEVSMTAVLTGPEKKLGIKCDFTVPDQVLLDPDLILNVPNQQRFYTGMDCYIHAVEAITGKYINTFSQAFAEKSLDLCREVYLDPNIDREEADEKLMVASYMGGLSLTYSQVGVCHALSYGLSYVMHTRHGEANCIAFNHLEEVYGDYVKEFHEMLKINNVNLPKGYTSNLNEDEMNQMIEISYALDHMWDHAFGDNWQEVLTRERLRGFFQRM